MHAFIQQFAGSSHFRHGKFNFDPSQTRMQSLGKLRFEVACIRGGEAFKRFKLSTRRWNDFALFISPKTKRNIVYAIDYRRTV